MKKSLILLIILIISSCELPFFEEPSSVKAVSVFNLTNGLGTYPGEIRDSYILVEVPKGTDLTALKADFSFSGTAVYVNGVEQRPNSSVNDFSNRLDFVVEAENGSQHTYTVVAYVQGSEFIVEYNVVSDLNLQNTLFLPIAYDGLYDFVIDWGDGSIATYDTSYFTSGPAFDYHTKRIFHTYPEDTLYTVTIYGQCEGFGYGSQSNSSPHSRGESIQILQWGNVKLHNHGEQFSSCDIIVGSGAIDAPDLSNVTNGESMFSFTRLSTVGKDFTAGWDTSSFTNMNNMFSFADLESETLKDLDTDNVTSMKHMFYNVSLADVSISHFNTSKVKDMSGMFTGASYFNELNADLRGWDVSNVENMYWMFSLTEYVNPHIGNWDVRNVTEATDMFGPYFNQDLSNLHFANFIPQYIDDAVDGPFAGTPRMLNKTEWHPKWGP